MLTEADCLPTGKDERAEIGEVIGAINKHLHTCEITQLEEGKASIDGLVFDTETLYCFQNNEHHEEGWLYNHIIGMLQHLDTFKNESYHDTKVGNMRNELEVAIFWSDLGKLSTMKDSPKKTWPDGTPQSTAFGHAEASSRMFVEAFMQANPSPDWIDIMKMQTIDFIVAEHMNAHKLAEMDEQGKTTIPEFLKAQVCLEEDLNALEPRLTDPWNWPKWEELEIPHGANMGKKAYAWIRRGASKLLRIKQKCDEYGRISKKSFN